MVRFEPRGCGRSGFDGNYDLDTSIGDIDFIRQEYGFDQVLLIGHSYGPDLALAYALKYPEKMLGIIGIAGGRIVNDRSWSETYHLNLENVGEVHPKNFIADPAVNKSGNSSWHRYIKRPGLLGDISRIDFPVSYICAGADIRPNWPTRQLANLVPGGTFVEIPDASHYIWLTHAEALLQHLQEAIKRVQLD